MTSTITETKTETYHTCLNIAGKAHAATGYGWKTSRGTYQPAIAIHRLYTLPPLAGNPGPQTYTPAAITRRRFETAEEAAACANDYLDRAAYQVVADWLSHPQDVISPGNFEGIKLKGSQWNALADLAGTSLRDEWRNLPDDIHSELVALAEQYLQANATDITGLEVAEHHQAAVKEMAQ